MRRLFNFLGGLLVGRNGQSAPGVERLVASPENVTFADTNNEVTAKDKLADSICKQAEAILQGDGFTRSGRIEAAKSLAAYKAMTSGEAVVASGADYYKTNGIDFLNIVGIAILGRDISDHYIVHINFDRSGPTPPKYAPLADFVSQMKVGGDVMEYFEALPRMQDMGLFETIAVSGNEIG